jgi:hypothetical protein
VRILTMGNGFSIHTTCNAMSARLFVISTYQLPGHQTPEEVRTAVAV